jgi:hypothetical protein
LENCYSCHDNRKATNNCEGCHTNLTNLTPKSHLSKNYLNEHKMVSDASSEKNNCIMCHTDNFCQACHSPISYQGNNTEENFYMPYYTKENAVRTDRASLQKLSNAHNLGYKFTHGLDAQSKSFECRSCHEQETFCASCHMNDADVITVVPKSHQQQGFTTLGVPPVADCTRNLPKKI